MENVVIFQRRLTHYRLPLFAKLRELLASSGVNLRLCVGQPTLEELAKKDAGRLDWSEELPTSYILNGRVCWQPVHRFVKDARLIIVPQENRLIANQLLFWSPFRKRLAFWGHGANFQGTSTTLSEAYKSWMSSKVHWWFAYTSLSADVVARNGFARERITVLQNAIDTAQLRAAVDRVTDAQIDAHFETLRLSRRSVAVFIGSLYPEKRLSFLVAAAAEIRRAVPDFALIVIGDGPARGALERLVAGAPHIRLVGAQTGQTKALFLKSAKLILNPGLVGLNILDSFASGVPLVTTDCGLHSPEIAYLRTGQNGLMTLDSLEAYTAGCIHLLSDEVARQSIASACLVEGGPLTVENMAANFHSGVLSALAAAPL